MGHLCWVLGGDIACSHALPEPGGDDSYQADHPIPANIYEPESIRLSFKNSFLGDACQQKLRWSYSVYIRLSVHTWIHIHIELNSGQGRAGQGCGTEQTRLAAWGLTVDSWLICTVL